MVLEAVGSKLTEDQTLGMMAALWGFLAKALSGPAMTLFRGADDLNGFDACRRVIVYITSGKGIHLEDLRRT